ncbi:hypothetical protein [uncultured Parabacteroides sp.]|uniref:hypothetical protein n=1 Tax=uncultured Parabacteroides sp. TaxID=512312 RepID=UPI002584FC8C|nr:hypothetical protein [uncultured Parabacteroides sp.]
MIFIIVDSRNQKKRLVRSVCHLRLAYKAAFSEWDIMTVRYQVFLTRLFTRDRQRTLNFLLEYTVLGTLRFDLQQPDIILRFIAQMEKRRPDYKPSLVHLAFSLLLTLSYKGSVEYLGDQLREKWLTAEDLNMLNDKTLITNEPGHKQPKVK